MGLSIPNLIRILMELIKLIFAQEKFAKPGTQKENAVLLGMTPHLRSSGDNLDWFKWFIVLSQIIKAIVEILNNAFGHDWGKDEKPDNKK